MKNFAVRKILSFLLGACVLAGGVLLPVLHGATRTAAPWEVEAVDALLAAIPPDQALVQVGDMQLLVSRMRELRAHLTGHPGVKSAFDGVALPWPGGEVAYTFDPSVSPAKQQAFLDGVAEWATFARVRFLARSTQANYVTIRENPAIGGGQSAVGMVGGQQFLEIAPGAWSRAVICHEIGHVLGLVHEHQRSDRDAFVSIRATNVTAGYAASFVRLGNSANVSPYDFLSVMHFRRDAYSVEPGVLDTIVPQPPYAGFLDLIGTRYDQVLSPGDRAGMAARYGAGPVLSGVVTNTLDSGPGSLRAALYHALDNPGTLITFAIPTNDPGFANGVYTIRPTDNLPALAHGTTLDGGTVAANSNPDGPEIVLNGARCDPASVYSDGLRLTGTNCVVQSLVINGFPGAGIMIDGPNATGNVVRGCYVGVNAAGTAAVTNHSVPLAITGGASGNTVGGTTAAARNVFSGSAVDGVHLRGRGTRHNRVIGNFIGLNARGTAALSNAHAGVLVYSGAQDNHIGGTNTGEGNVISGNGYEGLGIAGTNATGNVVAGNLIGLNAAGSSPVPNAWSGVSVFGGARSNLIGGFTPAARNVISGNSQQGLILAEAGTSDNVVAGNYVGLNPAGTSPLPNAWSGLQIYGGAQRNLIGGTTPGARNAISGNSFQGVLLSGAGTAGNLIAGNLIGLNAAGTAAVPNGWSGLEFSSQAHSNLVGGATAGAGNIISGNRQYGLVITGTGHDAAGNIVGLDATGTRAVPNGWSGVTLGNARGNVIGGPATGAGNLISGNAHYGINLSGSNTAGNLIQGNRIGPDVSGAPGVGNGWDGIGIYGGAHSNVVGLSRLGAGAPNQIAFNSGGGLAVFDQGTTHNTLRANLVFANANLGINLFGGSETFLGNTYNDFEDADAGPNHLQNYPQLLEALAHGRITRVSGTFSGAPGRAVILDLHASDNADPSGFGEGQRHLGNATVTTDGAGVATFSLELPGNLSGRQISATATDQATGDTSEFSLALAVVDGPEWPEFASAPALTPTGFVARARLIVGERYRVQSATNLGATPVVWVDLTNFTAGSASFLFHDRTATNAARRFYRIISP